MKLFDKLFKNKNVCKIEGDNNTVVQQIDVEETEELVVPLVPVKALFSFTLAVENKEVKAGQVIRIASHRADELEKKGFVKRI